MDICSEIENARNYGLVHCGIIDESINLNQLALRLELFFKPNLYRKVSYEQAIILVQRILHFDLAYNSELMSQVKAEKLTNRFFDCFDRENAQYYTNGDFYTAKSSFSWTPATNATFDTGILVISSSRVGCIWVEDED